MNQEGKSDIHLHVVSFDIPFPANYGGVIDVYYKALALTKLGVKVHLHCFEHGGKRSRELEDLFFEVKYYQLNTSKSNLLRRTPFIVAMRQSKQLVQDLLSDEYPVLLEGLHTTFLLWEEKLKNRKFLLRTHNVEHEYFQNLYKVESGWKKKLYFFLEAAKLKKYESHLWEADAILAISVKDYEYFSARFKNVHYLPAFHPNEEVTSQTGKGTYALYHGNLGIPENANAAARLLREVFQDTDIPFKIAGLHPPLGLRQMVSEYPNAALIADPDDKNLDALIRNAQVNILYTDQATGLKLKLLNAVYKGRFVLANDKMVSGSNLEKLCITAHSTSEMKDLLAGIMKSDFSDSLKKQRRDLVGKLYGSKENAKKLLELIA